MNIQHNVPLAPYTTFHIGGPADSFIQVSSSAELIEAIQYAKENHLDFFVLGQGANILVGDKGFRGLVIKNEAKKINALSSGEGVGGEGENLILTAESGVTIKEL